MTTERPLRACLSRVVPPKYSDGPAMIGLDRLPSIPLLVAATSAHNVRGACLGVQNICAVAGGEPRTPAPTHRAATFNSETAEADHCRPNFLALAKTGLGRLDILSDHRQAGDGRRLAPEGFPFVLDVENPSWPARSASGFRRGSRFDSDDEL